MLRILLIFILLTLTGFITIWIKKDPGNISIEWQGWLIEASLPITVSLILLLFVIILLAYFILKKIISIPKSVKNNYNNNKKIKADKAIIKAFSAKYMGEAELAENYSLQAKFLNNTPLKLLLDSEINNYYGNDNKYLEHLNMMLEHPETLLISIKKLTTTHIKNRNINEALRIISMIPKSKNTPKWFFYTSLQLNILENNWIPVNNCIKNISKYTKTSHTALKLIKSRIFLYKALKERNNIDFQDIDNSLKNDPTFAPAIVFKAKLLYKKDKIIGLNFVKKSWKNYSHPDITDFLINIFSNKPKHELLSIIKSITKLDNDKYNNNYTLAKVALLAESWKLARQAINAIPEKEWTKSIYLMMADLEKKEHGDQNKSNIWYKKSQNASLDFTWGCTSCSYIANQWDLICPKCSSLDSIQWQQFRDPSIYIENKDSINKHNKISNTFSTIDSSGGIIEDLNTGIDR